MWWVLIALFLIVWISGGLGEAPFSDVKLFRRSVDSDSDSDSEDWSEDSLPAGPPPPQCDSGYVQEGDRCIRTIEMPMPLVENDVIMCPMGFNPDLNDSSSCTADSGLGQMLFNPQIKHVHSDSANVDSWVETQQSDSDLHCETKNLGNNHLAVCTRKIDQAGYSPELRNMHSNPNDAQRSNPVNYRVVYKKADRVPSISVCHADDVVMDGKCYKQDCLPEYTLKQTVEGPICSRTDSYTL